MAPKNKNPYNGIRDRAWNREAHVMFNRRKALGLFGALFGAAPLWAGLPSQDGNRREIAKVSNDLYGRSPLMDEIDSHEFVFRTSIPAGTWRQIHLAEDSGNIDQ
jgi:hypothetical protein